MATTFSLDHPIAALASAPGPSCRGIIRLSGKDVRPLLDACFEPDDRPAWRSSRAARRFSGRVKFSQDSVRPRCDLYEWPTGRSYTGQPMAEFHLPGSPPLLERVLEELYRLGVRPASPGEFTLRAFLAGKIDLVQAEGVLGVVDARTDAELRTALDQLAGGISTRLLQLRQNLLELLADLEAGLDFVEEDIEFISRQSAFERIAVARQFIESLLDQSAGRMTSSAVPKVVLAGLPNAGKSTLFNAFIGQVAALVSPERGTTRDYLRANITEHGVTFELIDTAGWEDDKEGISAAAQLQRADQFRRADLIIWCSACNQDESQRLADDAAFQEADDSSTQVLRIGTKSDQNGAEFPDWLCVSASTEAGLEDLRQSLASALAGESTRSHPWLGTTAARCRDSLERAQAALLGAEEAAGFESAGDELLAVDLREALEHLGAVVGAVYTDDLLDRIFSKFCIGK